jgi:N utilization substance protein A
MTASVYLDPDQVSLAIGKGGLNIKLSKMLTGYNIDVFRNIEGGDYPLSEFSDVIEAWQIEALSAVGLDRAKAVIALSAEEIAERADLEVEQAEAIIAILERELEQSEE